MENEKSTTNASKEACGCIRQAHTNSRIKYLFKILKDAGNVSHEVAKKIAESEFERFRIVQDNNFESDFDKTFKHIKPPKKSN